MQGGPNTTRLVTTRNDNILPAKALRQPVDAMQSNEALSLLAAGLPEGQIRPQQRELTALEHFSIRLGVSRVREISVAFFFGNTFEK
jgi:hypothetical protein